MNSVQASFSPSVVLLSIINGLLEDHMTLDLDPEADELLKKFVCVGNPFWGFQIEFYWVTTNRVRLKSVVPN